MKAVKGYAILVAIAIAPFELRAEISNQVVTIDHGSGTRLPEVGGYPGISDGDSFSNQIGVGQTSSGLTYSLIDRPEGRFETGATSFINFGPPFWWGSWSASFSASNVTTPYSIGSDSGGFNYGFNSTESGKLFVRYFEGGSRGQAYGGVQFYDSASGWSYVDGILGAVIDVEFNYSAETPLISAEGPFFLQRHVLRIALPGAGGVAGASDWSGFAESSFIWGHGALPGSSPDVPLLPSEITDDGGFVIDVITEGTPDDIVYIDPVMAIGYDYVSESIPFRSVLIPDVLPGGDDTFDLLFGSYIFSLTAGIEFDFTAIVPDGISEFSIRGIDPGEMLDPTDPTAFVTGVTFMAAGPTEVIMTPISVPEVSSSLLAMLPIGIFVLSRFSGKR
jgi:hypothetical protein